MAPIGVHSCGTPNWTRPGRLRPVIGQEFELAAAAGAHAAIEARTTVGKTLLTVRR
jgi:NADPH:quinone reductase-like Zn-dependent oxidoreductase